MKWAARVFGGSGAIVGRVCAMACAGLMTGVWLVGCAAPKSDGMAETSDGYVAYSGAVDPKFFRRGEGIDHLTIFSPLDLPTPSTVRTASGSPGPDYWQQRCDYRIDARLDAEKKVITGWERVKYTNNSPEALPYIWVHLEQNIFRKDSIGAQSVEPGTRFGHRGFEGGITVKAVRLASPSEDVGSPTGGDGLGYRIYDTMMRVDLPGPIPPKGGVFEFEMEWSFEVPAKGIDRMGMDDLEQGTVFEVAQWYPAVAVFDDVYGWNTLPYIGNGEFYFDFGDFDVRLTVPANHTVVATGELKNADSALTQTQRDRLAQARESDSPVMIIGADEVGKEGVVRTGTNDTTWIFHAEDVRSFAWASSKAFLWDACFLKESGPSGPDGKLRGTMCQSVYPKEAMPLWGDQATKFLRFSIDHYNRMWHNYPYPVATNVNGIVGGMEYPMIIFCSERKDENGLFGVTTHEIGHNWFPMLVNTDERRHAWMDEGFNTFINHYAELERKPGKKVEGRQSLQGLVDNLRHGQQQPSDTPPDRTWRGRVGFLDYGKPEMSLRLLREVVLGPERFDPAFRSYVRQWAFKAPRPADFFRVMENEAGMDLAWFWRGFFVGTGRLDQAVVGVENTPDGKWAAVVFESRGELVMPAEYVVKFRDGREEKRKLPVEVWATTTQWRAAVDGKAEDIVRVEIDPDEVLPDMERGNNVWERK